MEKTKNYFRLQELLVDEGTPMLRKIFKQRYRQLKNKAWKSSDKSSIEFLETFTQSSHCLKFQRDIVKEKDLAKFDICLLSDLIKYMDKPLDGQGKFHGKLKTENKAIKELKDLRNGLFHPPSLKLDANSFEESWEKISETLKILGVPQDRINKVRNGSKYEATPQTITTNMKDIDDAILIFKRNQKLLDDPDDYKRASAYHFFAKLFETGTNVKLDYGRAHMYYEKSIKLGNTHSMCDLGLMYIEGRGALDIEKGVELIERAANSQLEDDRLEQPFSESKAQGVAYAQFHLGECFEKGIGKPEDLAQATTWYKRASTNGSAAAANSLAKLFYNEKDAPGNYEKAQQYWRLAASRGNGESMVWLASMYLEELNPQLAEQWFEESLKSGNVSTNKGEFLSRLAEQRRPTTEWAKTTDNLTPIDIVEQLAELSITSNTDDEHATNVQLTNPLRIESVVRFRKMVEIKDSTNLRTDESLQSTDPYILDNFFKMTIRDIITTTVQFYKGRFISLTATEDPKTLNRDIYIMAKDANNDILNIIFNGLDEDTVKDQLGFGSKFNILNPFFLSTEVVGIQTIWVEDPEDILVDSEVNKSICRFCWRENPQRSCAKCKRAKYCGRECQVNDRKLLKHKFICNPELRE